MERWRIGVVVDPEPGHEHLRGMMSIPYLTPAGVVDMKFRCMQNHVCKDVGHTKYMKAGGPPSAGASKVVKAWLFNAQAVLDAHDFVVLTEGELDAYAVEALADMPAVGQPGSTVWAQVPYWPRVFDQLRVFILADGDDAGVKGARVVAETLPDPVVIRMPDGFDANSFLVEFGPDELCRKLGV